MADMEMDTKNTDGCSKEESQQIEYIKDINAKILKNRKDICQTNIASKRSEVVTNMSLDDVIAERKILEIPKKVYKNNHFVDRDFSADDLNLSLDQIMHKKSPMNKDRSNIERSLGDIINDKKSKNVTNRGNGHGSAEEDIDEEMNSNEGNSHGRKRKRLVDDDEDAFVPSPLEVIAKLSQEGLIIEQSIGKQSDPMDGRSHNWRVKYTCGTISVQCESARKILAKQGAALELIKQMREIDGNPQLQLPRCAIPEACYYDPVVCERLEEQTRMMDMGEPRFEVVQTRNSNRDYFTTTYFVGEDEFIGCAYKLDDSKVLAAKGAFETYSGTKFHRDTYFIGEKCKVDKEYTTQETEATHILTLKNAGTVNLEDETSLLMREDEEDRVLDQEEFLVDDQGQMFVRSADGSNKIRRLNPVSVQELVENKLLEMVNGVNGAASDVDDF